MNILNAASLHDNFFRDDEKGQTTGLTEKRLSTENDVKSRIETMDVNIFYAS